MRELKEGRSWEREEISAEEAKQRFLEENEPYKVELVDTAEGDISLYTQFLKTGASSPTSAAGRTCRTRSRSRRSS